MPDHLITDLAALEALYGPVAAPSTAKEANHLHPAYARWIAQARFALLATSGEHGPDVSPRGDAGPLVRIVDEHTLLLPERRGNNRIDSLRNVLADPRVGLLFLVPGVDETLRVNGRARITVDPAVMGRCAVQGARPKCALWIEVDEVFFQCGRALIRSSLWAPRAADAPRPVPTAGQMLAALTEGTVGGADYDAALPQRQRATLYAD